MYYVYILRSKIDKSFYIGYSTDLKKRIEAHKRGESLATKFKRPFKLIYYEVFINQKDAKNREEYLKSGWGWRSVKKLLKNYLNQRQISVGCESGCQPEDDPPWAEIGWS